MSSKTKQAPSVPGYGYESLLSDPRLIRGSIDDDLKRTRWQDWILAPPATTHSDSLFTTITTTTLVVLFLPDSHDTMGEPC